MDTIHDEKYIAIIERLKCAREEGDMTQSQLGDRLDRDQTFVSKYESRERRLDVVELRDICHALGISLIELLEVFDQPMTNNDAEKVFEVESAAVTTFLNAPELDSEWDGTNWKQLIDWFVENKLLGYKEIGSLMLGHINPPQVGTSIASKATFQSCFEPRKTWEAVRNWYYQQTGKCADCDTRLELQADHIETREDKGNEADKLENMTLRCRRCNVVRRPSHKQGGQTFLTAEAALMWILFVKRPDTYEKFEKMCRAYGLTMANIRFQEAWAMAKWLNVEGLYEIAEGSKY